LDERTIRVALSGELDLRRAYSFDEELRRIEADHPPVIVLDLRRLDFLDSAGLGRVLACHRRARRDKRRLVIARSPGAVQRVLALAALDDILEIVDRPARVVA
jgi:anti-anti-sigma factor